MCNFRERRLFEGGGGDEGDNFIIESNFDEDEDFFVYISVYIFIKLMIDNFSTLLSISLMN